jgi:DNA-binding FadR family transcriptional regulator
VKINALERPLSLAAQIAAALTREITEGRLKPGDRLPTEHYLAANFNVSRNVVREAIAHLRSQGMVVSRQGYGTVVAPVGAEAPMPIDLGAGRPNFQHVYELRLGIEMQSAALAARRGAQPAFDAISETLDRMQEVARWETDGVDLDLAFHVAVARASGNPLIVDAIGFLTGQMSETIIATRQRSGAAIGEVKRLTIDEHAAIRDAIVARDADGARRAVLRHITYAAHRLGYDLGEAIDRGTA